MASPRFLAACATALLLGLGPVAASAQTTLTMSSWVGPTHLLTRGRAAASGRPTVEKATNGRVKFQMLPKHPSAPPGTFDAVRDGLVDVSYVTASYTPARHPLPLLAELPGAGATAEINSVAFSRIHWKYLQAANEYKGVKLLGVFTHGPGQMFLAKKPVTWVADLAGMKIRSGGGISEAVGQGARRLAAGQARARVVRDPVLGHRRRHLLPVGIDQVLQPRQGRQVRDLLPRRLLFARRSASS